MNISKETVDRHRKNMLNKTGLNSTGELIAKSIRQGWI
ncbi:MAG: helix-turn-helix transcriptional regulator [Mucilaginibacter sp.]